MQMPLPNFTIMRDDGAISLHLLTKGRRAVVIDCWTTRCEKCPAALDALNSVAETYRHDDSVYFLALQLDSDVEMAHEVIEEHEWNYLHHGRLMEVTKEGLKKLFGFSQVPYYIVAVENQVVMASGIKQFSYKLLSDYLSCDDEEDEEFI